jgi:F-type H+-transporting ATPase subunit b
MNLIFLAEEEEVNPLTPHVAEIVLAVVVFLILVYLIRKYAMPNFETTFANRTAAIEGGLAEAARKQAEADAQLAELTRQLSEARHEAARIREEAREQGAQIVAEMREQAQAESGRITAAAHAQVEAEKQHVLAQLKTEVGTLATGLAGRIVGESLEDEVRQRRTIERFISELDEQPVGQGS